MTFRAWLFGGWSRRRGLPIAEDAGGISLTTPVDPATAAKSDWQRHVETRHGGKEPTPGHCKYLDDMIARGKGSSATTNSESVQMSSSAAVSGVNNQEKPDNGELLEEDVLDPNAVQSTVKPEEPKREDEHLSNPSHGEKPKELIEGLAESREYGVTRLVDESEESTEVPFEEMFGYIAENVFNDGSTESDLNRFKNVSFDSEIVGEGEEEGVVFTIDLHDDSYDEAATDELQQRLHAMYAKTKGLSESDFEAMDSGDNGVVRFFFPKKALQHIKDVKDGKIVVNQWEGRQGLDIGIVGSKSEDTWEGTVSDECIGIQGEDPALSEDDYNKLTTMDFSSLMPHVPKQWEEGGELNDAAKTSLWIMKKAGYEDDDIGTRLAFFNCNVDVSDPKDFILDCLLSETNRDRKNELKKNVPLLYSGEDYGECCLNALSAIGSRSGLDSVTIAFEDILNEQISPDEFETKKKIAREMWKSFSTFKRTDDGKYKNACCSYGNDVYLDKSTKSWNGSRQAVYHELGHSVLNRAMAGKTRREVGQLFQKIYNAAKEDFSMLSRSKNLVDSLKNAGYSRSRDIIEGFASILTNESSSVSEDACAFCDIVQAMNGLGDGIKMCGHGEDYYLNPPPGGWEDVRRRAHEVVANITAALMDGTLSMTRDHFGNLMSVIGRELYGIQPTETEVL